MPVDSGPSDWRLRRTAAEGDICMQGRGGAPGMSLLGIVADEGSAPGLSSLYILTPTKVDTGKYVIEVKKIGDNLYQIIDTEICVETRYCHEWASFSEKVVLIIESNYGYSKGKIIFD